MTFISSTICPSDLVQVFAFEDDYSFGVLQSAAHFAWFRRKSSRLKVEADTRYSVREVFETFPWPQGSDYRGPTASQVEAVARAAQAVRQARIVALRSVDGGLRALYRLLDETPGKSPLREAHRDLDDAVNAAYGFDSDVDIAGQLARLNAAVASRIENGHPVVSPGVPPSFGDPERLISIDCYS